VHEHNPFSHLDIVIAPDRSLFDRPGSTTLTPFEFKSAAHLMRIERERASTIGDLRQALQTCPESSIFQHTFRTLQEHHFIREGFSNDFAHWAYTECGQVALGERLASIDVRQFTSLADLRSRLVQIVGEFLDQVPQARGASAPNPFYFCSAHTVVMPTGRLAADVKTFAEGIRAVSVHCLHYHFLEARLRRQLETNDFSLWLETNLGLPEAARQIERIDVYTSTLEDVRLQILRILTAELQ
jgi:hypothetical protein